MQPSVRTLLGVTLTLIALAGAGFVALFRFLSGPGPAVPSPTAAPEGALAETTPGAAWQVFFTHPQDPASRTLRGGPDAALAKAIAQAAQSVDLAAHDLDLWSIRDALLQAARNGVPVRVVAESHNLDRPEFHALRAAEIPVVGDGREGLMHHKFAIIDGYEVWTGSMNFTLNGAYRNDNNLLRLRSTRLAADFTTEFEEMFRGHHFGPDALANTPYPRVSLDGVPVEVYFAPDDHPLVRLLDLVRQAHKRVCFLAFNFTDDDLAAELLALHQRGVPVRGVFEAQQVASSTGNEYPHLRQAGLAVRLDGNPYNMHHKVFVIDDRWVVTGSYNFTRSAEERNDEALLIFDSPTLAATYMAEFERVWALAQP